MNNRTVAWLCFGALVTAFLAGLALYYPQLPDQVASHFGAKGKADGFSDKQSFVVIQAMTLGLLILILVPIVIALPKIPTSMINLPHKDYWLAPERADATYRALGNAFLWFVNTTLLLMVFLMIATFRANLKPEPALGYEFFVVMGLYAVFAVVWTILLLVRYGRLPPESATTPDTTA